LREHLVGWHTGRVGDRVGINGERRHRNNLHDFGLTQSVTAKALEVLFRETLGITRAFEPEEDDVTFGGEMSVTLETSRSSAAASIPSIRQQARCAASQ
jgi:hypothetical protein